MNHYVVGFYFSADISSVLLINKTHPEWQRGKKNGVGGKVVGSELPHEAMAREFQEEAGVLVCEWKHFATLTDTISFTVDWFWSVDIKGLEPRSMTQELVEWVPVMQVLLGNVAVVPNVKWFLQMAKNDIRKVDSCDFFRITEASHR